MKELKTVEDLGRWIKFSKDPFGKKFVRRHLVDYDELRAEAVKWLSSIQVQGKWGEIAPMSAEQWIKWFFNLTEEDLKGGLKE